MVAGSLAGAGATDDAASDVTAVDGVKEGLAAMRLGPAAPRFLQPGRSRDSSDAESDADAPYGPAGHLGDDTLAGLADVSAAAALAGLSSASLVAPEDEPDDLDDPAALAAPAAAASEFSDLSDLSEPSDDTAAAAVAAAPRGIKGDDWLGLTQICEQFDAVRGLAIFTQRDYVAALRALGYQQRPLWESVLRHLGARPGRKGVDGAPRPWIARLAQFQRAYAAGLETAGLAERLEALVYGRPFNAWRRAAAAGVRRAQLEEGLHAAAARRLFTRWRDAAAAQASRLAAVAAERDARLLAAAWARARRLAEISNRLVYRRALAVVQRQAKVAKTLAEAGAATATLGRLERVYGQWAGHARARLLRQKMQLGRGLAGWRRAARRRQAADALSEDIFVEKASRRVFRLLCSRLAIRRRGAQLAGELAQRRTQQGLEAWRRAARLRSLVPAVRKEAAAHLVRPALSAWACAAAQASASAQTAGEDVVRFRAAHALRLWSLACRQRLVSDRLAVSQCRDLLASWRQAVHDRRGLDYIELWRLRARLRAWAVAADAQARRADLAAQFAIWGDRQAGHSILQRWRAGVATRRAREARADEERLAAALGVLLARTADASEAELAGWRALRAARTKRLFAAWRATPALATAAALAASRKRHGEERCRGAQATVLAGWRSRVAALAAAYRAPEPVVLEHAVRVWRRATAFEAARLALAGDDYREGLLRASLATWRRGAGEDVRRELRGRRDAAARRRVLLRGRQVVQHCAAAEQHMRLWWARRALRRWLGRTDRGVVTPTRRGVLRLEGSAFRSTTARARELASLGAGLSTTGLGTGSGAGSGAGLAGTPTRPSPRNGGGAPAAPAAGRSLLASWRGRLASTSANENTSASASTPGGPAGPEQRPSPQRLFESRPGTAPTARGLGTD